jgi:hypothetical protein
MLLENSSKTRVFSLALGLRTLTRITYSWKISSIWPFTVPSQKPQFLLVPPKRERA